MFPASLNQPGKIAFLQDAFLPVVMLQGKKTSLFAPGDLFISQILMFAIITFSSSALLSIFLNYYYEFSASHCFFPRMHLFNRTYSNIAEFYSDSIT